MSIILSTIAVGFCTFYSYHSDQLIKDLLQSLQMSFPAKLLSDCSCSRRYSQNEEYWCEAAELNRGRVLSANKETTMTSFIF